MIVVHGRRLFQTYEKEQTENRLEEEKIIHEFIHELGLQLVSYKYASSTGRRKPNLEQFREIVKQLAPQNYISQLTRKYLELKFTFHYGLDDYIILAKKANS